MHYYCKYWLDFETLTIMYVFIFLLIASYLCVHLFMHSFVYVFVYFFVFLYICVFIYLLTYLFLCLYYPLMISFFKGTDEMAPFWASGVGRAQRRAHSLTEAILGHAWPITGDIMVDDG